MLFHFLHIAYRYTVDEDDEENERQAEIARRPLSNITATSICSTRDLIGPRGHDKPIPMDHQVSH